MHGVTMKWTLVYYYKSNNITTREHSNLQRRAETIKVQNQPKNKSRKG